MRKTLNATALMVCLYAGSYSLNAAITFNDIESWVGSGSNEAALVIDWNDGKIQESWIWGYRWDGLAYGADMLGAIADADPNLTISFGGTVESNFFLLSIDYFDGSENHSGVSDFAPDSWGYYLGTGSDFSSVLWEISPVGASPSQFGDDSFPGRVLTDGVWDAWSFGPTDPQTFDHLAPPNTEPLAAQIVPEPSTYALLILGACVLGVMIRKGKRVNE
ncbi:MAG: PEP-CTERM sorting domain-containing protein [Verrucomicrobiota bacterium]